MKQVSKAHCQSCTSPPHFFPLICDSLLPITLSHPLLLRVSLPGHRVVGIVPESSRWIDQSIAETFDVVFTTLDHTAADCNQGLLFLPWWLLLLLLAVTHKGTFLSSTLTVRGDHLQHLQQQQHLYASALPCKTAFVEDAEYLSLLLLCLISFFSFFPFCTVIFRWNAVHDSHLLAYVTKEGGIGFRNSGDFLYPSDPYVSSFPCAFRSAADFVACNLKDAKVS